MTGERAVLVVDQSKTAISLPLDVELTIGRDPSSDVVLDSPGDSFFAKCGATTQTVIRWG